MLLAASYVFYGWWSVPFCGLLVLSTVLDYSVARIIEAYRATIMVGTPTFLDAIARAAAWAAAR